MVKVCATCTHWEMNKQRLIPIPYVPPKSHRTGWRKWLLGDGYDFWDEADVNIRREFAIDNNNSGKCRLNPQSVKTSRFHTCSHWRPL